jgi:cytochrome c oxidase cbb3-type subunit 3
MRRFGQTVGASVFVCPTGNGPANTLAPTDSRRRPVWMTALVLFALTGCDWPGKPNPAHRFVAPDQVIDFTTLFEKNCRGCHGAGGTFGPAPPLADSVFLAIVSDEELAMTVANGRPGTSMPAFLKSKGGTLTNQQIQVLVNGVRTLAKATDDKKSWPAYAVPETKGDAKRGAEVFAKACAGCHGPDGKGTKSMGAINEPAFLSLASEQFFRRIIITGRSDLGMPNCADGKGRGSDFMPLTDRDVTDVTALIMSWPRQSEVK